MLIELTPNEVMWIMDKVVTECARGKVHIDRHEKSTDPEMKAMVADAKKIVNALADLGLKLCSAMDKEVEKTETGGRILTNNLGRVALTGSPLAKSLIL